MDSPGTPCSAQEFPPPLAKGTFAPALATDLRSPCPMVNCLANHGYIARDGRNIYADELYTAVRDVGLSRGLAAALSYPIYHEHHAQQANKHYGRPWWRRVLASWLSNGSPLGMRRRGQVDSRGRAVLDLDQLALPGVIEHDVSLTRRDHQQPQGNAAPQADLLEDLLNSTSDGKTLSREDLAAFRTHRIAVQEEDNPGLRYGIKEHLFACGEIAFLLDLLGNGKKVPLEYIKAVLVEERLPVQEGWTKRRWWKLGFVELQVSVFKVWRLIGAKPKA